MRELARLASVTHQPTTHLHATTTYACVHSYEVERGEQVIVHSLTDDTLQHPVATHIPTTHDRHSLTHSITAVIHAPCSVLTKAPDDTRERAIESLSAAVRAIHK